MKYKVGDKVKVKKNICENYGIMDVEEYEGKILTIKGKWHGRASGYYVKENNYVWRPEMLEPVTSRSSIGKRAYKTFLKNGGKRDERGRFSKKTKVAWEAIEEQVAKDLAHYLDSNDFSVVKQKIQVDWDKMAEDMAYAYYSTEGSLYYPKTAKAIAKVFKKHNLLREGVEI